MQRSPLLFTSISLKSISLAYPPLTTPHSTGNILIRHPVYNVSNNFSPSRSQLLKLKSPPYLHNSIANEMTH